MIHRVIGAVCIMVMAIGLNLICTWRGGSAAADLAASVSQAEIPSYISAQGVQGRFTIAGSNTMFPLMTRLASRFKQYYPDVKIAVQGQGSKSVVEEEDGGRPFWQMVQDKAVYRRGDGSDDGHHVSMKVHVMASSHKLSQKAIETFRSRYGYEPLEIPIALEAVAVYVHRDNPLEGLALDQVDSIFSETHHRGLNQEISTWGQLGLQGGWQKAAVRLYGRDELSGTRAFFQEHVLLNGKFRPTINVTAGSASLIVAVGDDPLGIGYSGIGYVSSSVRVLPLAMKAGDPFVTPNATSARDGSYPLTRLLFLYINKKPTEALSPALLEFLKYVNSREGQETVVAAGVYPLSAGEVQQNMSRFMPERIAADKSK